MVREGFQDGARIGLPFLDKIVFTAIIFIHWILLIIPEFLCSALVGFENGHKNSHIHFFHVETISKL